MTKTVIQIGSNIGNTINDPLFSNVNNTDTLILVEPVPFLFEQLKNNYNSKFENNNFIFINKAVSDYIGKIQMTVPSEKNDFSLLPYWASQLGSVDPSHALQHFSNTDLLLENIMVETTTLNQIVKEYNIQQIDVLHTDTEGHDYTILMNYNFEVKPKLIAFEHKHMDGYCNVGIKYIEISKKLLSLGYKIVYKNLEDTIFELDT
jgi:FkbM family methyltransferase